jgi:hypothetical protein
MKYFKINNIGFRINHYNKKDVWISIKDYTTLSFYSWSQRIDRNKLRQFIENHPLVLGS